MSENIYLIDANSFLHRAFHANNNLYNSNGTPIGAVYGTISMLKNFIAENIRSTDKFAVIFDHGGETFRHKKYPAYKANREETKPELTIQKPIVYDLIIKMGLPFYKIPNVEADDIIGTIAKKYGAEGHTVTIVTGDKDFSQLITEDNHIKLFNAKTNEILDYDGIIKKYNIEPKYFIDYLAITGDAADNIPGINGIGNVGAINLINKFGGLKDIYENIEEVKTSNIKRANNLYTSLIEKKENARLSYFLAKIQTELKLDFINDLNNFVAKEINTKELSEALLKCGLKKFNSQLANGTFLTFKQSKEVKKLKM